MRKVIVTEFISVDGIAEVEKLPEVTWNEEMQRFKEDELADSGAMLLGAQPMRFLPARGLRKPETLPTGLTRCRNMSPRPA